MTTRGSVALLGAFTAYGLIVRPLDSVSSAGQQILLSLSAWVFLAVALALQPPARRVQVLTPVCVATVLEVIGSIIRGAYRYRLGNLPLSSCPRATGSSTSPHSGRRRCRSRGDTRSGS